MKYINNIELFFSFLYCVFYSLRADVVSLLAPVETIPEAASEVEEDEGVMTALFGDIVPPPDPSRTAGKHHRSLDHTSDVDEARWA